MISQRHQAIALCTVHLYFVVCRGGFRGGAHPVRAPPKIGKNMNFFWHKIMIFHMKYPKNFACPPPPLKLEKYDFLA